MNSLKLFKKLKIGLIQIAFLFLVISLPTLTIQAQSDTEIKQSKDLMIALKSKDHSKALLLAKECSYVDYSEGSNKISLLMEASRNGFVEVCRILIDKGAKVDLTTIDSGNGPINFSGSYTAKKLPDPNAGETALMFASDQGHLEVVKLLIEKGAKIDRKSDSGSTALILAAYKGHSNVCKLLFEKGVNIQTSNGDYALRNAIYNGHSEVVKLLLEKGCKIDFETKLDIGFLELIIEKGHLEVLKLVINEDKIHKLESSDEPTLLMLAVKYEKVDIAKFFIENGAKVNIQKEGKSGQSSALHQAATIGNSELCKLLLDNGADINLRSPSYEKESALIDATYKGHLEVVKLLIERGAMIDLPSSSGMTALHFASAGGKSDIVKYLLDKGANKRLKDNEGKKAKDLATNREIEKLF